jgi:hypothetical protein
MRFAIIAAVALAAAAPARAEPAYNPRHHIQIECDGDLPAGLTVWVHRSHDWVELRSGAIHRQARRPRPDGQREFSRLPAGVEVRPATRDILIDVSILREWADPRWLKLWAEGLDWDEAPTLDLYAAPPFVYKLPAAGPKVPTVADLVAAGISKDLAPHFKLDAVHKTGQAPGYLPFPVEVRDGRWVPRPAGGKATRIKLRVTVPTDDGDQAPTGVRVSVGGRSLPAAGPDIPLTDILLAARTPDPWTLHRGTVPFAVTAELSADGTFDVPRAWTAAPEHMVPDTEGRIAVACPAAARTARLTLPRPSGVAAWPTAPTVEVADAAGPWRSVPKTDVTDDGLAFRPGRTKPARVRVRLGPAFDPVEVRFAWAMAVGAPPVRGWVVLPPEGGFPVGTRLWATDPKTLARTEIAYDPALGRLALPAGRSWAEARGQSIEAWAPGCCLGLTADADTLMPAVAGPRKPGRAGTYLFVLNDLGPVTRDGRESEDRVIQVQRHVAVGLMTAAQPSGGREGLVRARPAAAGRPELVSTKAEAPTLGVRHAGRLTDLSAAVRGVLTDPGTGDAAADLRVVVVTPYGDKPADHPAAAWLRGLAAETKGAVRVVTVVVGSPAALTADDLAAGYVNPVPVPTGPGINLRAAAATAVERALAAAGVEARSE